MEFLKDKLKLRAYQEKILETTKDNNTLVVIPTGLGKTMIAVALSAERFNSGKILFLAPTKPLVQQHLATFSKYFVGENTDLVAFSGEIPAQTRKKLWSGAKIVFSTPQTIRNDLQNQIISLADVSLLVIDEAHRTIGEYAYVFVSKKYIEDRTDARIVGLTASPASSKSKLKEISDALSIDVIELRSRTSKDVVDYIMPVKLTYEFIRLTPEIENISGLLGDKSLIIVLFE